MICKKEFKRVIPSNELSNLTGQGISIDVAYAQALAEIERLKDELTQARSGIIQRLFDRFAESEITELKKKVKRLSRNVIG